MRNKRRLLEATADGPVSIDKLPVMHGTAYTYDINRLKKGDTLTWILEMKIEGTEPFRCRFEVDIL